MMPKYVISHMLLFAALVAWLIKSWNWMAGLWLASMLVFVIPRIKFHNPGFWLHIIAGLYFLANF